MFAQIGWVGFQGNLTVQIWSGLFGWGHVLLIGVILTVAMITNNVLGFTGVASFARYVVATADVRLAAVPRHQGADH